MKCRIVHLFQTKLRVKMAAAFVTLSLLSISAIIILSYKYFANSLLENHVDASQKSLSLLADTVESYFLAVDNAALSLYTDTIMSPDVYSSSMPDYLQSGTITRELWRMYMQHKATRGIVLYLFDTQRFYAIDKHGDYEIWCDSDTILQIPQAQSLLSSQEMLVFPGIMSLGKDIVLENEDSKQHFTVGRSIYNGKKRVGLLLAYYSTDLIEQMLEKLKTDSNSLQLILADGSSIADVGDEALITTGPVSLPNASGSYTQFNSQNVEELVTYCALAQEQLYIIERSPMHVLLRQARTVRSVLLVIGICSVIFTAIVTAALSFGMTRRLAQLHQYMLHIQNGQRPTPPAVRGCDEISDISHTFVHLIGSIDQLIQEKYVMQMQTQQATIQALNAQINPHFLYNTLQTISAIAHRKGAEEIVQMIRSLASMLRYTIKPAQKLTDQVSTLEQECRNCQDYLCLLSYRYKDKLLYNIQLDPSCNSVLVPRLMLLTLVENAVKHGIDPAMGTGVIHVKGILEGEKCVIMVSDTGAGMDADQIKSLLESLKAPSSSEHLGLQNIYSRLKILYGEDFDLSIQSNPNKRTTVCVILYKPHNKEDEI